MIKKMLGEIPELQRKEENMYKLPERRNKLPKKENGSDQPQAKLSATRAKTKQQKTMYRILRS